MRALRVLLVIIAVACLAGAAYFLLRGDDDVPAAGDFSGAEAAPVPEPPSGPRARVEVLNGTGRSGLARAAMEHLRERGFDVVYFGNARARTPRSRVIDRSGNDAAARAVADAMSVAEVEVQPDTSLYLDVTVVVGQDWPPPEAQMRARSWTDRLKGWWREHF